MKKSRLSVLTVLIIMGISELFVNPMVSACQNVSLPEVEKELPLEEATGSAGMENEGGNDTVSQNEQSGENESNTIIENESISDPELPEQNPELESDAQEMLQDDMEKKDSENENISTEPLQIPQKVSIVIDPLEIKGRGQIYSEQYRMHNAGDTAGVLTITNYIEVSQEQDGVVVKADRTGLHQGQDKVIYLEMVLGNGETAAFTKEGANYTIRLEPDEELEFWFTGEVNENTSCSWKDEDVSLRIDYVWDMEEDPVVDEEWENASIGEDKKADQETAEGNETFTTDGENEANLEAGEGKEASIDGNGEDEPKPVGGNEVSGEENIEASQKSYEGDEASADRNRKEEQELADGNENISVYGNREKEELSDIGEVPIPEVEKYDNEEQYDENSIAREE